MGAENQNNRKHYRVYTKKNKSDSSNTCKTTNNKSVIFGMIGLAFLKGIFLGYILKGRRR